METIPLENDTECVSAEWDNVSHTQQVRYSIRKLQRVEEQKSVTYYFIFDNKENKLPEWAFCLHALRTFAVGRLQRYLAGMSPKSRYLLTKEWENSLVTFTLRKKSELRFPF